MAPSQPLQPNRPFNLGITVPRLVAWPGEPWVDFVNIAKDEFEVDCASTVFSTWRVQEAELLGGNKIVSCSYGGRTSGKAAWQHSMRRV